MVIRFVAQALGKLLATRVHNSEKAIIAEKKAAAAGEAPAGDGAQHWTVPRVFALLKSIFCRPGTAKPTRYATAQLPSPSQDCRVSFAGHSCNLVFNLMMRPLLSVELRCLARLYHSWEI